MTPVFAGTRPSEKKLDEGQTGGCTCIASAGLSRSITYTLLAQVFVRSHDGMFEFGQGRSIFRFDRADASTIYFNGLPVLLVSFPDTPAERGGWSREGFLPGAGKVQVHQ